MMSKKEITRRVRAIAGGDRRRKPFTLHKLAKVSGVSNWTLIHIAQFEMIASTQAKLSMALQWLEKDQIRFDGDKINLVPPKPQCVMGMKYRVTDKGFEVVRVAKNPLAYQP